MKKYSISDLEISNENQIFESIMPGEHIYRGGTAFLKTGERTHDNESSPHIHDDIELFLVVEGSCNIEINSQIVDIASSGEIIIAEPGEDHHVIAVKPSIIMWCHGGSITHQEYSGRGK